MLPITDKNTVWPSAFQKVELPFYYANNKRNEMLRAKKAEKDPWGGVKIIAMTGGYWPIAMCITPLSCLIDIIAGVAQAALSAYRDRSFIQARSILYKKILISPVQHAVYWTINLIPPLLQGALISAATGLSIFSGKNTKFLMSGGLTVVLIGPMLGPVSHYTAQRAVGQLSKWVYFDGFSIFINGGSLNPTGLRFTDPEYAEQLYSTFKSKSKQKQTSGTLPGNKIVTNWDSYITSIRLELSHINPLSNGLEPFDLFSKLVRSEEIPTTKALLGIQGEVTAHNLKKAFLVKTLIVHADKNLDRVKEAEALFKALCQARELLEQELTC